MNPLCVWWNRELARYAALGEDLPAGSLLARHVARCEGCRAVWSDLRALAAELPRAVPAPPLPESFTETLWARLDAVTPQRVGARGAGGRRWSLSESLSLRPAALGTVLAIALLAALGLEFARWHHGRGIGQPAEIAQRTDVLPRKREMNESAKGDGTRDLRPPLLVSPPSPRLSRLASASEPGSASLTPSPPHLLTPSPPHLLTPSPHPGDDMAYLNTDPVAMGRGWAPRAAATEWEALERWVRRNVRVRDDFVRIPFPRVASTADQSIPAAVEGYKREAAVVDARLFQKVTLQEKAVSFDDFCRELARQSSIQIEAGRGVADEKVTAFVKERPLREVMREIGRLFGYTWLRSGKPGEYRYELEQDLRSQLLEEELRNRDLNEALLAMDREMQALRPYLSMTPEALRAKAEQASTAEEKKRLEFLAGAGGGALRMYFQLSPEEMVALRSGQQLVYSSQPGEKDRALPAEMRLSVLGAFSHYRLWRQGESHGFGPAGHVPAGAEQYEPKALPEVAASVFLSTSRSELGQIALVGGSGFATGGGGMSTSDTMATGVSPSVASPGNALANAALARDPALQAVVSWRPESSCRCGGDYPRSYSIARDEAVAARQAMFEEAAKAERDPLLVSTADVLAAIHRATGIDLLSDAYTRLFPPAVVSVEKSRLFDGLNRTADAMHYRWRKEGGMLLFRSDGSFNDKLKEVPNRLLARWAASFREHGRPTLDDIIEIAQLRDAQLDSKVIGEGAVQCWGIKGWDLARSPNLRKHLRFLGSLDAEQRRLALTPAGLPFRRMNGRQQQQYLAVAFGDSSSAVAPEALLAARLRVDLSMPGEFEWVPRDEWDMFPTERRVRAASRERALAAARQREPTVTAGDILPTTADLRIDYELGPGPDGRKQYAIYASQGARSGREPASVSRPS